MSNILGYICVAIVSVGIASYAIYKKKDTYKVSTLIVFYLFASTITWMGEFIVLGLFNSYAYKTDLLLDPWAQNLMGHLFLNTTMYPAAATVMVAYSLRYGMIALVTVIFVLLEYIFAKLGLYEQHWWRYYMSVINVVAYMLIARKWFSKISNGCYGLTRAITFYFVAFIFIHISTPILLLLGKQHYHLSFINKMIDNFYLSSTVIAFVYHLISCGVFVFFVCILKKWYWKIAPSIISIVALSTFKQLNILVIDNGWKLIYYIIIQQFFIFLFILIEKYTLQPGFNRAERND